MFASRLPARLEPTGLSLAVAEARAAGADFIDLTETNPTAVGLVYPDAIWTHLADPGSARYEPDPRGLLEARAVVAGALGSTVSAEQVVLAASTSEAYGWLFKLLCDAGDEVLVPQPSYPLFDLLTRLEVVRPVAYRLDRHAGWALDRAQLLAALSPRTRAILVVSPNNPTGSFLEADDREWLVALAADRKIPIVADEVFADYPLQQHVRVPTLAGESRALVFTLGGLSKSVGLPQLKLAWILVSGPSDVVAEASARLEIIADTYLSVSTPVQRAIAGMLGFGGEVRGQIHSRIRANLSRLADEVRQAPALTLLAPEAGWTAVVRAPALGGDDAAVLRLLRRGRVLVHPGYFFDFEDEGFFVISLLPEPGRFAEGVRRLVQNLEGGAHG